MTLNDLERLFDVKIRFRPTLCCSIDAYFGAHCTNLNEDRSILSRLLVGWGRKTSFPSGMCSRTTWSRPRPGVFEAKATKFCPRGVLEVEASRRGPPPLGFYGTMLRRERLCQVACLSITLKFNALLPPLVCLFTMKYCIYVMTVESFTY